MKTEAALNLFFVVLCAFGVGSAFGSWGLGAATFSYLLLSEPWKRAKR